MPQADGLLQLPALLAAQAARNFSASLADQQVVWTQTGVSSSGGSEFTLDVMVRVPPRQPVLVGPSLSEALKWGWVQFLATFAAVWWLGGWLEWGAFRLRMFETRVVSDMAPRVHKYDG